MEFSKLLMMADYAVMLLLVLLTIACQTVDLTGVCIAWVAQLGVSTGAYYWKTRSDNRVKVPMNVLKSLPKSMREDLDMTEIITSIIRSE